MAYIWATSYTVPLVLHILEDNHARVYAHVLHVYFGFRLSSIYMEEEVLSRLYKVNRSILQLRFCDNEGYY
jgi:hypothetical protein